MLAVERSRTGEAASRRIGRIVKPDSNVKRVGGSQGNIWVKPENFIHQNSLNCNLGVASFVGLNVGLGI